LKLNVRQRILVNLKTDVILDGKRYDGTIQNLSKHGMMVSANTALKFTNKAEVEIKCKLPSDDTLHLHCKVIWYTIRKSSQQFKFSMGLTIFNPPIIYNDFLHFINKPSATVGV
jgi:hypothetical protein